MLSALADGKVVIYMAPNTRACTPQRESSVMELIQRGRISSFYVRYPADGGQAGPLLRRSLPRCVVRQIARRPTYTLYKVTRIPGGNHDTRNGTSPSDNEA